ncbi:MAG: ATP-dependent helicase [Chitinophagaceae bacterium]
MNHPPYLDKLNDVQREAAMNINGPVMIIAGAGSGKTRVLTYRIAHIIKQGNDAFNILALTFTNKAAREMKERIETVVGTEARNIWMGTFHSVFAKILRIEAEKIGYPRDFTIYDTDDAKSLIKTILKEMNLDEKLYKPGLVYNRISNCKNNLITHKEYISIPDLLEADASSGRPLISKIFAAYQSRCFKAGAMDFDDLLLNTHRLFKEHADVLYKYQHKFKFIMVDEYQDTNLCQYMIVKSLANMYENICVVGDDSQSIYSFRGANIQNILNFEKDYPDLKVFKLEHNYRSTATIVNASTSIIANNKEKLDKHIYTDNPDGDKIAVMRLPSDNEEGKAVATSIFEEKNQKRLNNSDFAILYRTNAQSRAFEESLRKMNIKYRVYGGISFYQRKEVKDLIAYLRLVVNPNDEEALKRIINYPARKIGATTIDKLVVLAAENEVPVMEIVKNAHMFPILGSAVAHIRDFSMMIGSFQTMLKAKNAYEIAEYVAKQSTLLKTLYEDKTVEGVSKYENIVELLNGIKEFTEDDTNENEKTLSVFLQEIALYTDADKDEDGDDKVTMMTIHSSKGLEFKHVYVVGLEENLFPSQLSLSSRQELEEERRLFYVAITRAEEKLTLSYATSRFKYGNLIPCEPSRFLEEIDPKYLDMSAVVNVRQESMFRPKENKETKAFGTGYGMNVGKAVSRPLPQVKVSENFTPSDASAIAEGQTVEHQRFGMGKVMKLEDTGDNRKAMIEFEGLGTKTLVLKFAKLMIHP